MQTDAILTSYVADVAERLPTRMRGDVARELGALLGEELAARAGAAGRAPDRAMALDLLAAFGHPAQVAARYHRPWAIVDPIDTRSFVLSAVAGASFLALVGREGLGLAWLGVLLLVFAARSWLRRGREDRDAWRPRQASRAGNLALVALIWVAIVAYGAPGWLFAWLSGGGVLAPVFDYDPAFATYRLPMLLSLWAAQSVLLAWSIRHPLETPVYRRMQLGFSLATLGLLLFFLLAGPVFGDAQMNAGAQWLLRAASAVMALDVALKLYRERVRAGAEHLAGSAAVS